MARLCRCATAAFCVVLTLTSDANTDGAQAGLPDGLFSVVLGARSTGEKLVRHPDIAKVSFTGEVGTGKTIVAEAAKTLKHVTMELGGKPL